MYGWSILEFFKMAVYWGAYLLIPAAAALVVVVHRMRGARRVAALVALAPVCLLFYARFIEPRILLTVAHETTLERCFADAGAARLAVFSDPHQGIFGNAIGMARIARRVNAAAPDAVFIAGDLVYFLDPARFAETFDPLRLIGAPVYAVLGNHDVGIPGPDVGDPLARALATAGVNVIDDRTETLLTRGRTLEIVGVSDLWAKKQELTRLAQPTTRPRIALTHNPETILHLNPERPVDLMLAGHTHGGQIYIPFLTCRMLTFACKVTRYGFAETPGGRVFVTSGAGMVGLPMRFGVPPRIDVITVTWRACESGSEAEKPAQFY